MQQIWPSLDLLHIFVPKICRNAGGKQINMLAEAAVQTDFSADRQPLFVF